jgi:hypothetical protein
VILSLVLTGCAAPGLPPATPTIISSPTFPAATQTPTPEPTATAIPEYDYSTFDIKDKTTWPDEQVAYYVALANRPASTDASTLERYKLEDQKFHDFITIGLQDYLARQGVDMSELKGKTDLESSIKTIEKTGIWQRMSFESTGQAATLIPGDPWLMRAMIGSLNTNIMGAGEQNGDVPVFGVPTERILLSNFAMFNLTALMENPADPANTAIIIANCAGFADGEVAAGVGGMRPFLVNFKEHPADNNMLVYDQGYFIRGSQKGPILTIFEDNAIGRKVDLSKQYFIQRATDGTGDSQTTAGLNLNDVFRLIGNQVSGYQTSSLRGDNYADDPNGYVAFQGLFDATSGVEILEGITYATGLPTKP